MTQSTEQRRLIRLASSYNTKARRMGVRGIIIAEDLGLVVLTSPECYYCGVGLEVGQGSFDHVVPLDRGGGNTIANLVRSCLRCNRRKFTKTPEQLVEHDARWVTCARAECGILFKPRWAEYEAGRARLCSRRCSALWRWERAHAPT